MASVRSLSSRATSHSAWTTTRRPRTAPHDASTTPRPDRTRLTCIGTDRRSCSLAWRSEGTMSLATPQYEPIRVHLGQIACTDTQVHTPVGTYPLAGTIWSVTNQ